MHNRPTIGIVLKLARHGVNVALAECAAATLLGVAGPCAAAARAFDSAADPTYNRQLDGTTGWVSGSNGGFGFGPWQAFNTPPGVPLGIVGSSTTNGTGDLDNDGDINTPRNASGRAWGLTAAPPTNTTAADLSGASRMFSGELGTGQTFSIDFDNGSLADPVFGGTDHPGSVEWDLKGAGETFGLEAIAGTANYILLGGNTRLDSGIPLTYEGLHCEFTPLGPSPISPFPLGWMMEVTPLSPGSQTYTFRGTRLGPITGFGVGDSGGGLDPANALYINNIEIVPEPGAVGVVGVGAMLLMRRRRG